MVQGSFSVNVTIRSFPDGSRLIETVGAQNRLTFTANGKSVTFIEVGHEVGRIAPDGTLTFSHSGRSWLEGLIGHWVSDPDSRRLHLRGRAQCRPSASLHAAGYIASDSLTLRDG